jgi:hypothetical protein
MRRIDRRSFAVTLDAPTVITKITKDTKGTKKIATLRRLGGLPHKITREKARNRDREAELRSE